jgi:hypothetical protein
VAAIRKPARAGPATRPSWKIAWNMALAAGTSDRSTRLGTTAPCAELAKVPSPAPTAGHRNSGHRAGVPDALIDRPALVTAEPIDTTISKRRRSAWSATAPP